MKKFHRLKDKVTYCLGRRIQRSGKVSTMIYESGESVTSLGLGASGFVY